MRHNLNKVSFISKSVAAFMVAISIAALAQDTTSEDEQYLLEQFYIPESPTPKALTPAFGFGVGSELFMHDLNGDGVPDALVVAVNQYSGVTYSPATAMLGNAVGAFGQPNSLNGCSPDRVSAPAALGDVNGDGNVDLVCIGISSSDPITTLLGNSDGTFQSPISNGIYVTDTPNIIFTGLIDVDGDHKPDLITIDSYYGNVGVFHGNGDGTFQAPLYYSLGASPISATVVDVNGDGIPDVVASMACAAPYTSCVIDVMLGNGDGTFQPPVNLAVSGAPESIAVSDVNNDGIPDIIVADDINNTVNVLIGKGQGLFAVQRDYPISNNSYPCDLKIVDVNNDGIPDIVTENTDAQGCVGGTPESFSVLLGEGDGTFRSAVTSATSNVESGVFANGIPPPNFAVVDMNGDGKPDLVTMDVQGAIGVQFGNGDGTFSGQLHVIGGEFSRNYPLEVITSIADINGDGKNDVIEVGDKTVGTSGISITTFLGNGDGTFAQGQTYTSSVFSPFPAIGEVAVQDVTGDGIPDVIGVKSLPSGCGSSCYYLETIIGNSQGTYSPGPESFLYLSNANNSSAELGLIGPMFLADVTHNGILDFVSEGLLISVDKSGNTSSTSCTYVVAGNGDGSFGTKNVFAPCIPIAAVSNDKSDYLLAVGDANGDGTPDLVVANIDANGKKYISVFPGNGDGTFGVPVVTNLPASFPAGFGTVSAYAIPVSDFKLIDINGDGKADIVALDASNQIVVILGNGDGSFQAPLVSPQPENGPPLNASIGTQSIAVADINDDGKLDIVTASRGSAVDVWIGNGDGTFQSPQSYAIQPSYIDSRAEPPVNIAVADLNSDGMADIAAVDGDGYINILLHQLLVSNATGGTSGSGGSGGSSNGSGGSSNSNGNGSSGSGGSSSGSGGSSNSNSGGSNGAASSNGSGGGGGGLNLIALCVLGILSLLRKCGRSG